MKPRNIFIHHDGALGDTLLSLPCINAIRESSPNIHIAGRRDVVQFLKEAGIADDVSSVDSQLYSRLYTESLDDKITGFLSCFDQSFVFTNKADSQLVENIRSVISATRAILTIPPESCGEHAAEFRVKQLGFGEDAAHGKITICIPDNDTIWATEFLRKQGHVAGRDSLFTVHPGSGGKKKCWSLENYAAVVQYFTKDSRVLCIVLTGPAEDAAMVSSRMVCSKRVIPLHDQSLIRIAAVLSLSDFYAGNDSGISHLAGILGCRGAVLFGPTDPPIWRPQGDALDVIRFSGSGSEAASEIISRFKSAISRHQRDNNTMQSPKKTSVADAE